MAQELGEIDPKPVTHFTPDNLEEVMGDFLSGKRRNPDNATYSKLDKLDFIGRAESYDRLLDEVMNHPDIPVKHHRVYENYIERSKNVLELMHQASLFRTFEVDEDRQLAKARFQELNELLYGKPDKNMAAGMTSEILKDTQDIQIPNIARIRSEFIELVPKELLSSADAESVITQPSQDARDTVSRVVQFVYSPLLTHADKLLEAQAVEEGVSQQELRVPAQGIATIFQEVIDREFSGSGWNVLLEDTNAIQVDVVSKKIKVPLDRTPASADKVKGLVVHELGVHMLRSIIGEKSNLIPLRYGLSGGNEAEEGIAKVMESTLTDDAARTGYQHYLTATLLGMGLDFRDTHEIMWRYKVLDTHLNKPGAVADNKFIERRKKEAFNFVFRSVRGTNMLPWHLTLSYFMGTPRMWNFVEKHKGDPDFVTIMFMGKIDPSNQDHLKSALDAVGRLPTAGH